MLDNKTDTVAGAQIEKIGTQGDYIFGHITIMERRPAEDSDTPGYFLIDSAKGTVTKGLKLGPWSEALKALGITEPRLLSPESMGPRY